MKRFEFTVPLTLVRSLRADSFLCDQEGLCSRSQLKQRVVLVKINDTPAKLSRKIYPGDRIEVELDDPRRIDLVPEKIDLNILYEDERVIVVDKPQGVVVHPAPGNYFGTLVHGLLYYREVEADADNLRPGIVHRLDKDTSGVLITAKDQQAHEFLSAQFQNKTTRKEYFALCRGKVEPESGIIENRLGRSRRNRQRFTEVAAGGKPARTRYRVLRQFTNAAFVALYPETGRTHQLRVHMSELKHPVIGDALYGRGEKDGCTLMLHAFRLRIILPGNTESTLFTAPLPKRFGEAIRILKTRG